MIHLKIISSPHENLFIETPLKCRKRPKTHSFSRVKLSIDLFDIL